MTTTRTIVLGLVSLIVLSACAGLIGDTIEALMKQAIDLFVAGKYEAAITKFLEVVRRDPKHWNAYLYLARSYVATGSWSDALTSGRRALELAPQRTEVVSALAEALLGAGLDAVKRRQFGEAVKHLAEYVSLRPADVRGYLELARAYISTGAWGNAIASGRKALELAPQRMEVVGALAEALVGGGLDALNRRQFGEAVKYLTEYVSLRPADVRGYVDLARAYLGSGGYAEALRTLTQGLTNAREGNVRSELTRLMLDGGTQALAAGNVRAATSLLQEYVRHDAGNVSAYLALGKAYWQDGRVVNALDAFRRVLELDPNQTEAREFLRGGR